MPTKLEVEYVYAGALLHDDALVHSYIQVEDGKLAAEGAVVYAKPLSKHKVGSVLRFLAMDTPDNLIVGTATYMKMWHDIEQTAVWSTMSDAVITSEKAYTKALGNPEPLISAFDAVRKAYAKLEARERAILLARIVAYIASED